MSIIQTIRGIAQLGSARRSGRRGRRFKSGYPDKMGFQTQSKSHKSLILWLLCFLSYQNKPM